MHLASSLLCDLGIGWSVGRGQSIMISIGVGTGGGRGQGGEWTEIIYMVHCRIVFYIANSLESDFFPYLASPALKVKLKFTPLLSPSFQRSWNFQLVGQSVHHLVGGSVSRSIKSCTPVPTEGLVCENTSCYITSRWTSVDVSMETPPFTMTSFQSAYGQVVAW